MNKVYKNPESVLVVIYSQTSQRFLVLRRNDDPLFWQSVTGSMEKGETPRQTALREVAEETGILIESMGLALHDLQHTVEFEIFPQFLHRYAPDVRYNKEHWFCLNIAQATPIILTEHSAYQWLDYQSALAKIPSWNNRDALGEVYHHFM